VKYDQDGRPWKLRIRKQEKQTQQNNFKSSQLLSHREKYLLKREIWNLNFVFNYIKVNGSGDGIMVINTITDIKSRVEV